LYYIDLGAVNKQGKFSGGKVMQKLISSAIVLSVLSLALTGCGMQDDPVTTAGNAGAGFVKRGVTATGEAVGSGVKATGAVVGSGVSAGVGLLVGQTATEQDKLIYRKKGVVYRNGHAYHIRDGKYVLVR